jgi:hypothetical protein
MGMAKRIAPMRNDGAEPPQVTNQSCKPIGKPDAAGPSETGETEKV